MNGMGRLEGVTVASSCIQEQRRKMQSKMGSKAEYFYCEGHHIHDHKHTLIHGNSAALPADSVITISEDYMSEYTETLNDMDSERGEVICGTDRLQKCSVFEKRGLYENAIDNTLLSSSGIQIGDQNTMNIGEQFDADPGNDSDDNVILQNTKTFRHNMSAVVRGNGNTVNINLPVFITLDESLFKKNTGHGQYQDDSWRPNITLNIKLVQVEDRKGRNSLDVNIETHSHNGKATPTEYHKESSARVYREDANDTMLSNAWKISSVLIEKFRALYGMMVRTIRKGSVEIELVPMEQGAVTKMLEAVETGAICEIFQDMLNNKEVQQFLTEGNFALDVHIKQVKVAAAGASIEGMTLNKECKQKQTTSSGLINISRNANMSEHVTMPEPREYTHQFHGCSRTVYLINLLRRKSWFFRVCGLSCLLIFLVVFLIASCSINSGMGMLGKNNTKCCDVLTLKHARPSVPLSRTLVRAKSRTQTLSKTKVVIAPRPKEGIQRRHFAFGI